MCNNKELVGTVHCNFDFRAFCLQISYEINDYKTELKRLPKVEIKDCSVWVML